MRSTLAGLLAAPVATDRVPLSPAERAEVVVDFAPGDQVTLHSYAGPNDRRWCTPTRSPGYWWPRRWSGPSGRPA
jgi:FtsP/CotA-like multicopper oxidase with cupredoxin domain